MGNEEGFGFLREDILGVAFKEMLDPEFGRLRLLLMLKVQVLVA